MSAKDKLKGAIRKAVEDNDSTDLENLVRQAYGDDDIAMAILDELIPDADSSNQ
jgi:hypothetical protein